MTHAKTMLILAVAAVGLALPTFARAEAMTGTLIDNMCGDKKKDEADAANHKAACAKKDNCAASGYQLIVGDKHYKLDDKGNDQAKEYLKDHTSMKVTVDGKAEGDKLEVASIKEAEKKPE